MQTPGGSSTLLVQGVGKQLPRLTTHSVSANFALSSAAITRASQHIKTASVASLCSVLSPAFPLNLTSRPESVLDILLYYVELNGS
jgi:hypothetical protein